MHIKGVFKHYLIITNIFSEMAMRHNPAFQGSRGARSARPRIKGPAISEFRKQFSAGAPNARPDCRGKQSFFTTNDWCREKYY